MIEVEQPNNETVSEVTTPQLTEDMQIAQQCVQWLMSAIPVARIKINDRLTGNQAKRILIALLESPLENEDRKFTTQEAWDVFELGAKITAAKYELFKRSAPVLNQAEKELAEEQAAKELQTEEQGENNE